MKLNVFFALTVVGNSTRAPRIVRKRPRTVHVVTTTTTTTTTPEPIEPRDEWEFPLPVAIGLEIVDISSRGRLVERYDMRDVARTYGNATVALLTEQQRLDERHDVFTPQTQNTVMREITQFGELDIGRVVARSGQGIIFELPQVPEMLIKYQANCFEISDHYELDDAVVHPLIFDAQYGYEASMYDLSMDVLFVSPPAMLCPTRTGKCEFGGLSDEQYEGCRFGGGSVRYMILKKSNGMSLARFRTTRGGKLPFDLAMTAGATVMQMLQVLHTRAGIVHGDIHEGNFMVENNTDGTGNLTLKMIDFGRASKIRLYPEERALSRFLFGNTFLTQWQIDGHRSAPRDDAIKAVQMITHMVHDYSDFSLIEQYYEELGYAGLRWFKIEENWFSPLIPGTWDSRLDAVASLSITDAAKEEIRIHLANILGMVRGLNSPNQAIPYGAIQDAFMACANLATQNNTTNTSH